MKFIVSTILLLGTNRNPMGRILVQFAKESQDSVPPYLQSAVLHKLQCIAVCCGV